MLLLTFSKQYVDQKIDQEVAKANIEFIARKKYGPEKPLSTQENERCARRGVLNGIYKAILEWAKPDILALPSLIN